ncbi:MAG: aminotransferase class I/II-fold pyridoxal phosphate-dependent enzyme [Myxococcales bacterium]|nr:aminotransferase class I/II-fold pyridoxal phosphate-dependent enzyme [Myxococcales bacterium]
MSAEPAPATTAPAHHPLGALAARVPEPLRATAAYHVPRPAQILAKLDANELPFALPDELLEGLSAVLRDAALERYPDANATELRAALAATLGAAPEQLVFGNGSDELIAMLCSAFAAPRGTRPAAIAYPVPTFVYYRLATIARGLEPVEVPLTSRFELDEAAFVAAMEREDPSVVFLALPNNPTGTMWRCEFALELAARFPRTVIVSDEAYLAYSGQTNLGALVPEVSCPNLVVMRTLSKVGMAGLRVGYLVAAPALAQHLEKVRPPYNLGSLPQAAARFLITTGASWCQARAAEVVQQRGHLAGELERRGFEVFPSAANLLLVRTEPGRAHRIWQALQDRGVLVRDFDRPGPLAGCLRITVGTAGDHQILLEALDQVL